MAFFHLSLKPIQRGKGKSLIAAIAYRAGIKAESMYSGDNFDYTKKKWITHVNLMLPYGIEQEKPEFKDIETFFNAVELAESASDARLAIELEIALPHEIPLEKQIELAESFTKENFIDKGCAALLCMHWPPKHDDLGRALDSEGNPTEDVSQMDFNSNPHIHLVIPSRTIGADGKFEPKSQIEYICKRGNRTQAFTASEFPEAKEKGWEKQYRYIDPNTQKKIWLTQLEAAAQGLDNSSRTSKQPKTTPYGRKNPKVQYLSDSKSLELWRKSWETLCNEKLKECGIDARIDRRSLSEQGRGNEMPTVHLGHDANLMKLRAERLAKEGRNPNEIKRPDKEILSERIREYNKMVQTGYALDKAIKIKITETKNRLTEIKNRKDKLAKENRALKAELSQLQRLADKEISEEQRAKESLGMIESINANALAVIDALETELAACSKFDITKRKNLMQMIETEKQKIADRENYQAAFEKKAGNISSQKWQELQIKSDAIQAEMDALDMEYQSTLFSIPEELKEKLESSEITKSGELRHSK